MAYKIYQVVSDPYQFDDGTWMIAIKWLDDETEEMGDGQVAIPFYETGAALLRYFRHNVEPLDDDGLQKIIKESQMGVMQ